MKKAELLKLIIFVYLSTFDFNITFDVKRKNKVLKIVRDKIVIFKSEAVIHLRSIHPSLKDSTYGYFRTCYICPIDFKLDMVITVIIKSNLESVATRNH